MGRRVAVKVVKVGKGERCSVGGFEGVTTPSPWKILTLRLPKGVEPTPKGFCSITFNWQKL